LVKAIERAYLLTKQGETLFASPALHWFLNQQPNAAQFFENQTNLHFYTLLDDEDIMWAIKVWSNHEDLVLSTLCKNLINRKLPKMVFSNQAFEQQEIDNYKQALCEQMPIDIELTDYFVYTDSVKNSAYNLDKFNIKILFKNGQTTEISKASDQYNIEALSKSVTKYFLCYPKFIKQ
jgi:hypothetical protein